MFYEALPEYTQNLIMVNFEFFGKIFLLFLAFSFSIYYGYYKHKNQEETPYFFVGLIRSALYLLSKLVIWIFPMTLFFLYPQIRLDTVLSYLLTFYTISFFVFGIILFINVISIGPLIVMKVGAYNPLGKRTDKLLEGVLGKKAVRFMDNAIVKAYHKEIKEFVDNKKEWLE